MGTFSSTVKSDVVGDTRAGEVHQCRLSVPQAKAAFMASQSGGGGSPEDALLDFDELLEAVARCGVDKYRAVKPMSAAQGVSGFVANLVGEKSEDQVISEITYIHAARFDASKVSAVAGQSEEELAEWRRVWGVLALEGIHAFPLWEKEVHDLLQPKFGELRSIFKAYACGTISADAGANDEMDMEEFNDFAIECTGLITKDYGFNVMANQFAKSDGLSSKDKVLDLAEFIALLVRISFYRANPSFGLLAKDAQSAAKLAEHAVELVTLPGCLEAMLLQHVLPHARRDNLHLFKTSTLLEADVQAALEEARSDLHTLYEKVKGGRPRLMLAEWQKLLQKQLLFGEFSISQHTCRLTQSQSKANFIASAADPVAGHSEEATRALTRTPDPSP